MNTLNEQEKRRPEFQEGSIPVALADGQTWMFPRPMVKLRPQFVGGRSSGLKITTTLGPEFDGLVEKIDDAFDAGDYPMVDYVNDVMNLGANLLLRNYDLTDDELVSLFVWKQDDAVADQMLTDILNAAKGIGPKASSGGSE